MTESLAASIRGPRLASFDEHMARVRALSTREVIALSKVRTLGLTEVFDLLADTDFVVSDWHGSWTAAHQAVHEVCLAHGLEGLADVCGAAADVAASQGLARLFGSDVSVDVHMRLSEPWRRVMERHAGL